MNQFGRIVFEESARRGLAATTTRHSICDCTAELRKCSASAQCGLNSFPYYALSIRNVSAGELQRLNNNEISATETSAYLHKNCVILQPSYNLASSFLWAQTTRKQTLFLTKLSNKRHSPVLLRLRLFRTCCPCSISFSLRRTEQADHTTPYSVNEQI